MSSVYGVISIILQVLQIIEFIARIITMFRTPSAEPEE